MNESSNSNNSHTEERDTRKKQADEMREKTYRAELTSAIREIFNKVRTENPLDHIKEVMQQGSIDDIRNEIIEVKRSLDVDSKLKRLSQDTVAHGAAFLKISQPVLDAKKQSDRLQNELKQFRSAEKRDSLEPRELTALRNLVIQLRQALQNIGLLNEQAIKQLSNYSQGRRKDMGEEAALHHSIQFYLQFVDSPQRARIETQIKEKTSGMPLERRIDALKIFIQNLVHISPSIRDAEAGRCIEMAQNFLQENHVDDAINELQRALEFGNTAEIHLQLADCWERKENREEVIAELQKAIHCSPDNLKPYLRLAELHENEGNATQAIPWYEKILEKQPDRLPMMNHTACLAFDARLWPSAIKWLTQVLQQKPKSKKTIMRLGIALIQSSEIERGEKLLLECRRSKMKDGRIDLYLGVAFRAQGHYTEARAAFQKALQQMPGDQDAIYWHALANFENGEYETAKQSCERLLSKNKNFLDAAVLLARTFNHLGEYQQSIEWLAPFVNQPGTRPDLLAEYGISCVKTNQNEDAYAVLQKAVSREPKNEKAREALGQACIQSGRFEESFQYMAPLED